jgi:glutathione S-transferase
MAVHIALHETGAPFEARPMSFATKDMHKPEVRAINPNGKVTTLLVDGRVLTEVAGIERARGRRLRQHRGALPARDGAARRQEDDRSSLPR